MADNTAQGGSDVLATDEISGGVADGVKVARSKTGYGVDGSYVDVALDSGLPVGPATLLLSAAASASGVIIDMIDARPFRAYLLTISGGSAFNKFQPEFSNDGTNWYSVPGHRIGLTYQGMAYSDAVSDGPLNGPVVGRYMRVRVTSYSSGTSTCYLQLTSYPFTPGGIVLGGSGGGPQVNAVITGVTNTLASDAQTSSATNFPPIAPLIFNGTNWDRIRNVTAVDGSGSTGLLAAGLIGHDAVAAVNRRVKLDGSGNLYSREPPAASATLSRVTSSAATGTLLAANAARRGVIVVNESTATLYIAYAATASATAYTQSLVAGATWEMPQPIYKDLLSCIWAAANGAAPVTELT